MRGNTVRLSVRIGVVIVLLLTVTAGPIGAATVDQEQEPNDGQEEAQEIALGEEVTGELTEGDVDWFRVTIESGRVVNISASTDGVGNTNFELLDSSGNQVASVSGLTAEGANVGTTSTYTGTYYLRVERRFTDRGGEYSFTVDTTGTDAFEPNEDPDNATELVDEEEIEGELTIGDADWFSIAVEQGETINLSAFADASGATNVQLYDRNVTLRTGEDGLTGGFACINATATYTGEYYVRVASRFADTYGATYNLTVDLPGEPPSETAGAQQDEAESEESEQTDETDDGLPIIPMVAVAAILVVVVIGWRFRDRDDEAS